MCFTVRDTQDLVTVCTGATPTHRDWVGYNIALYTTPVVEINCAVLWYITNIPQFVATLNMHHIFHEILPKL